MIVGGKGKYLFTYFFFKSTLLGLEYRTRLGDEHVVKVYLLYVMSKCVYIYYSYFLVVYMEMLYIK